MVLIVQLLIHLAFVVRHECEYDFESEPLEIESHDLDDVLNHKYGVVLQRKTGLHHGYAPYLIKQR